MTSDRLSLIVFAPAAASSRAADTELAGIHRAGPVTEIGRPVAGEAVDHLVGVGGFDADRHAAVADRVGGLVVLSASVLTCSAMDGSAMTATASSPSTQRAAAASVRLDSASPKKRHRMTPADHHDDGHQRGDHADTDTAATAGHGAVTTRPFAAFPVAAVLWGRRRRGSAWGGRCRGTRLAVPSRLGRVLGLLGLRPRRSSARCTRVRGIRDR